MAQHYEPVARQPGDRDAIGLIAAENVDPASTRCVLNRTFRSGACAHTDRDDTDIAVGQSAPIDEVVLVPEEEPFDAELCRGYFEATPWASIRSGRLRSCR